MLLHYIYILIKLSIPLDMEIRNTTCICPNAKRKRVLKEVISIQVVRD